MLAVGLLAATAVDIRTRRIPNLLTAAMAAAGLTLAALGASGTSIAGAMLGFLIGLLLMVPGHALGATGAGDVKLMAAVGAVVGPDAVIVAFLCTAVTGGVLAVLVAMRRGRLLATIEGTGRLIAAPGEAKRTIEAPARANRFAYGPAIAVGSMLAMLVR